VRVEFPSIIFGVEVDQDLVDETGKLDIFGGNEHLDTSKGTRRDEAGAVVLSTPGNLVGLGVTNGGVWLRRSPDAEIINVVDNGCLTF
jgi:hypothetical protein